MKLRLVRRVRDFFLGEPRSVFKDVTVSSDFDQAFVFISDDRQMKFEGNTFTRYPGLGIQIREDRHMNLLRRMWHRHMQVTRRRNVQVQHVGPGSIGIQARGDIYLDGEKVTSTKPKRQS